MNTKPTAELIVTYQSEVLGNGQFWQGRVDEIEEIRNIPARDIAREVAKDGKTRTIGMWKVEVKND